MLLTVFAGKFRFFDFSLDNGMLEFLQLSRHHGRKEPPILGFATMKEGNTKFCFCSSCWRDEYHTPVELDGFARGLIILMTLGLAAFFWPYRCRTCGHLRPQHWFARRA